MRDGHPGMQPGTWQSGLANGMLGDLPIILGGAAAGPVLGIIGEGIGEGIDAGGGAASQGAAGLGDDTGAGVDTGGEPPVNSGAGDGADPGAGGAGGDWPGAGSGMFNATLTDDSGTMLGGGTSAPVQDGDLENLPGFLQNLLDQAEANGLTCNNPGGCAELQAILDSGLSEGELNGTIMTVVRTGGPNAGMVGTPCPTCGFILGKLGITVTWGPGW